MGQGGVGQRGRGSDRESSDGAEREGLGLEGEGGLGLRWLGRRTSVSWKRGSVLGADQSASWMGTSASSEPYTFLHSPVTGSLRGRGRGWGEGMG